MTRAADGVDDEIPTWVRAIDAAVGTGQVSAVDVLEGIAARFEADNPRLNRLVAQGHDRRLA